MLPEDGLTHACCVECSISYVYSSCTAVKDAVLCVWEKKTKSSGNRVMWEWASWLV